MAIQPISCSTNDLGHNEISEKQVFVGKLCRINYLLILLAIVSSICSLLVPVLYPHRVKLVLLGLFILGFEVIAKPFSYYGITSKGLTEYRFGRKRRIIEWKQVIQVGRQLDNLARGATEGVIVTLQGAPKYTKHTKIRSFRYFLACRPNVLYIYDYHKTMPILQKFYGNADYITKSELPD